MFSGKIFVKLYFNKDKNESADVMNLYYVKSINTILLLHSYYWNVMVVQLQN